MTDLTTWYDETALALTGLLPLQSYDSAVTYAQSYLSNVGGWVPDIGEPSSGEGAPVNGKTPAEAAADITDIEFAQVYDLNFDLTVVLNTQFSLKLGAGLDLAGATSAMLTTLEEFVTDKINDSDIPIRLNSITTEVANAGSSKLGGLTSAAIRVVIADEIDSVDKIIDFKALTLQFARDTYGIDLTWNVKSVYTETNKPLVVIIAKYTDDATWDTLDVTATEIYVFSISPDTYEVVSGAILEI